MIVIMVIIIIIIIIIISSAGARGKSIVQLSTWPLRQEGKKPRQPIIRRLVVPQTRAERFGENIFWREYLDSTWKRTTDRLSLNLRICAN